MEIQVTEGLDSKAKMFRFYLGGSWDPLKSSEWEVNGKVNTLGRKARR